MTRSVVCLTPELLDQLGDHASRCTFWSLGTSRGSKADWLAQVLAEWGPPGLVLVVDGTPVGHLLVAPATYLHGAGHLRLTGSGRCSSRDLLLGDCYLAPEHRGHGHGRHLIQSMAAEVLRRGSASGVVAYGSRSRTPGCVLPTGFLNAVGFRTERPHPVYPRMRLDLRTTVTWKEELGQATERLLDAVRIPGAAPTPGSAASRQSLKPERIGAR